MPSPRTRSRRTTKGSYMHIISAEVLASIAKSKGFGPSRLARYAGHKNHSYMSRLMRGVPGARSVKHETARLIAEALDVPVHVLFVEKAVKSLDSTRKAKVVA
jgi:transcriptional regulator with XRE-family HTH domain